MVERCVIELYLDGAWHAAAEVRVADARSGFRSPSVLSYDFDYLDHVAERLGSRDRAAVSCRHPVGYEETPLPRWPAFLLDVIPSGAARRWWEAHLGLRNVESADWELLVRGGGNPPGNARIAGCDLEVNDGHPGFAREDVLERGAEFIEYAHRSGASVAGGSGAGGDAPKLLLREDEHGRLHADGALADARTRRCWLVKFPRSSRDADRLVLEAEAAYHRVAVRLGVRTGPSPTWERDALFLERFDRVVAGGIVDRLGLESLYSLAGVSDFGVATPKEELASAVAVATTDPNRELLELLVRDVLDVALGNTDNHGRNTAVTKRDGGIVELSPLYDFAPMVLDPQGIARVCRWRVESDGVPSWGDVLRTLAPLGLDVDAARRRLVDLRDALVSLPQLMVDLGVPPRVVTTLEARIARTADSLRNLP
jgi:serine/threonine-protein kinase HipA